MSSAETDVARTPLRAARAVGAGRAGAAHRDVRQRAEVGQREPVPLQVRRELAVADPRAHGDGLSSGSRDSAAGIAASETESPVVSAIALKEWPVPRARIRSLDATSSCSSGTLDGLEKRAAL